MTYNKVSYKVHCYLALLWQSLSIEGVQRRRRCRRRRRRRPRPRRPSTFSLNAYSSQSSDWILFKLGTWMRTTRTFNPMKSFSNNLENSNFDKFFLSSNFQISNRYSS